MTLCSREQDEERQQTEGGVYLVLVPGSGGASLRMETKRERWSRWKGRRRDVGGCGGTERA